MKYFVFDCYQLVNQYQPNQNILYETTFVYPSYDEAVHAAEEHFKARNLPLNSIVIHETRREAPAELFQHLWDEYDVSNQN